jgi:Tfp pilus assembly protein PilO
LIAGAVALVLFAYAFGLLLPARRTAAQLEAEEQGLRDRLALAESLYDEAGAATTEILALRERVDGLILPEADAIVASVRALERIADETGAIITRIRPGDPSVGEQTIRYPATVDVQATFSELVELLCELERPETRLWVEGVEIASGRQSGDDLRATVHVAAYRQAEEGENEDAQS